MSDLPDEVNLTTRLATADFLQVISSADCAWLTAQLRERDKLAAEVRQLQLNLETVAIERDRMREFARKIHREAGGGVTLAAHIRGRASGLTPAKRQLVLTVADWIDDWTARVSGVSP